MNMCFSIYGNSPSDCLSKFASGTVYRSQNASKCWGILSSGRDPSDKH